MITAVKFAFLMVCLSCYINVAELHPTMLAYLTPEEKIPAESLIPHSRVKRIQRDAFDSVPDRRVELHNLNENFGAIDSIDEQHATT